jgi:hypothetical protein
MSEKEKRSLGPKADGPKTSANLGNLAYFALGMIVTGVIGTVAFNSWLKNQIQDQIATSPTVKALNERISGIKIVMIPRPDLDVKFGCGETSKAGETSMFVMYGTTEGNSCKVPNYNYYKEVQLEIPD